MRHTSTGTVFWYITRAWQPRHSSARFIRQGQLLGVSRSVGIPLLNQATCVCQGLFHAQFCLLQLASIVAAGRLAGCSCMLALYVLPVSALESGAKFGPPSSIAKLRHRCNDATIRTGSKAFLPCPPAHCPPPAELAQPLGLGPYHLCYHQRYEKMQTILLL